MLGCPPSSGWTEEADDEIIDGGQVPPRLSPNHVPQVGARLNGVAAIFEDTIDSDGIEVANGGEGSEPHAPGS